MSLYDSGSPLSIVSAVSDGSSAAAGADSSLLDKDHQGTARQWAEVSAGIINNPECMKVAEYLPAEQT